MLANWITLSRFPLLLVSVVILYLGPPPVRLAGVAVLFLGLMLDTVDGVVARATGRSSLFGSVLDIAADRTYELVLWVCFANLGLVSAAIPPIVVARTTLTDALRSIGTSAGTAPFAQHRTTLGRFLVGSAWMRVAYSVSKVAAFCGLALAHAFSGFGPETTLGDMAGRMTAALRFMAWLAVAICVVRGLPVIAGSLRRYWGAPHPVEPVRTGS
ncbi:MAG: CDP-alcohol phosphatidyltransferase family protein [Gemmatimonadota bacterium]|nr:CDP-alcohol phosphatidyltransferase family protein [Gemmatimonadota bacterium]